MIRSSRSLALVWRLCAALLLAPGLAGPAQAAAPVAAVTDRAAAEAKIDPWVLAHAAGEPVEFLVVLDRQADLSGADALETKLEKGRYVFAALQQQAAETQGQLEAFLDRQGVDYRPFYIVNALWVRGDVALARDLAERAEVAHIDGNPQLAADLGGPDLANPAAVTPASPDGIEDSLQYVNADEVWAMGFTGQGIVVGGQDTGYDWDHPALKNHYRGWNGSSADHNYNWHDSIHTSSGNPCDNNSPEPCDDDDHGTHTMGTAVGSDGGSNQIGMAPGAKWIGCRNMDEGVGTPATYLECFEFFLAPYALGDNPADGNPDLAPDVTNNSWGCPEISEGCTTTTLLAALAAQRAAGIMTVVSAGNSGSSCSTVKDAPAFHADVYTVGALQTGTDTIATFSSRGPVTADGSNRRKPDLTAPGTNIRSSIPGGGYSSSFSGTSMAAPHVAGAVALLWSAVPGLRGQISATMDILNSTAVPIDSNACSSSGSPNNVYGYGRLDIKAAVDLALAQYGTLEGAVSDAETALPLSGAALVLAALPTQTYTTTTTALGAYSFSAPSGTYTLTVAAAGYFSTTLTGIAVTAAVTTTLPITLTPFPYHRWLPAMLRDPLLSADAFAFHEIASGGAPWPY